MVSCYHCAGVLPMSAKVDAVLRMIEQFSSDEMREFIARLADKLELLGWLKLAEQTFSDWDNEEDGAYDRI